MNKLGTIGICFFTIGVALIGYSLWIYSQQTEAAGLYFLPGMFFVLIASALGLIAFIKRRK